MAICQAMKCDFVIYCLKNFKILEIEFDDDYWAKMEQSLNKFYTTHMTPFILESAKAS